MTLSQLEIRNQTTVDGSTLLANAKISPLRVHHQIQINPNTLGVCIKQKNALFMGKHAQNAHKLNHFSAVGLPTSHKAHYSVEGQSVNATCGHGIPDSVITDNGLQFTSKEYCDFARQ